MMLDLSPSTTAILTGSIFYWLYYRLNYGKKPDLFCKRESKWSKFLDNHVASLKSVYWSLYWLPGGKFQTILAAVLPKQLDISYERETINTPDGGQFTLAWTDGSSSSDSNKPLVFIYPGLVSTSESSYVKTLTKAVTNKGYSAVVMVNRGLELPCLTGKAFCATHTMDVEQALSIVKKRHSTIPIVAIGISLGGLVLTRYLALKGAKSNLTAAFVYSCPFNPVVGSESIEKWDHWLLYNIKLTQNLKTIYTKSREKFTHLVDHDKIMNARSIREVDAHFTSKVFGYESVDHYYEDGIITKAMLHSIKTPTLCLCANDDAFVPQEALPCDHIKQTDHVALAVTAGGGHVSHLHGVNPYSTPYYIDMFLNFASAVFDNLHEVSSCLQ